MSAHKPTIPPRLQPPRTPKQNPSTPKAVPPPVVAASKIPLTKQDTNNDNDVVNDISKHYFIHEKKLGEGGFAKVRLATHLASGQSVAIKILEKMKLGSELPRVYNEIECLKKLKHKNIAKLYQVFETTTTIYLVLEYCSGGELFDYIVSKSKLEEPEAAQIIHDLMRVLEFIHANGFAHRDLKPENVLFDDKHQIKLIDFGLAANCSPGNMATSKGQQPLDQLSTCCGSVTYAAPEVISGGLYSGPEVDVWSAGVIMHALLIGQLPFNDRSVPKLYQKIQAGIQRLPSFLSPSASDLIRKMLTVDPKSRITVKQVLAHPWLLRRPQQPGSTHTFVRAVDSPLSVRWQNSPQVATVASRPFTPSRRNVLAGTPKRYCRSEPRKKRKIEFLTPKKSIVKRLLKSAKFIGSLQSAIRG